MKDGLEGGKNGTRKTSWKAAAPIQERRDDSLDEDDGGGEEES